jgi:hypothetical protein
MIAAVSNFSPSERRRIVGRRIDLERAGGDATHREAAGGRDQRHKTFQAHGLFGGAVTSLRENMANVVVDNTLALIEGRKPTSCLNPQVLKKLF